MKKLILLLFLTNFVSVFAIQNIDMADYNLNETDDATIAFLEAFKNIDKEKQTVINIPKGIYNFYPNDANLKEYFISNHDQDNPRYIGLEIKDQNNLIIEGNGSEFLFHGRIIPISILETKNIEIRNLTIDNSEPQIIQLEVLENNGNSVIARLAQNDKYKVKGGIPYFYGTNWELTLTSAIAFNPETGRILQDTSDIWMPFALAKEIGEDTFRVPIANRNLDPGTMLAGRSWKRPAPGIFVRNSENLKLKDVTVHYSEGMALIAQMTKDIHLDGFNVMLKEGTSRVYTSQADATHFSGCSGKIIAENSLYEAMMDDAINVHGTYLKITSKKGKKAVIGRYMHPQAYGFDWGYVGDEVQFINHKTMDLHDGINTIKNISPYKSDSIHGAKQFLIEFENELPKSLKNGHGIENLTQTPEVIFRNNTVRNNRARGTLFSTPKSTIVENNLFDHVAGTAILLCGDCNGWYETGACKDVVIRNNKFINCLTSNFQFTNAIISIYPEIPNLRIQKKYFHSGIKIEDNYFETFDRPILYAKSTQGLVFANNKIEKDSSLSAFHWNKNTFFLERCKDFVIKNNSFSSDYGFDKTKDVRLNLSDTESIQIN